MLLQIGTHEPCAHRCILVAGATDGCVKLWDMRQTTRPRDTAVYGPGTATMAHPVILGKTPRGQAGTLPLTGGARRSGVTCLQQPPRGARVWPLGFVATWQLLRQGVGKYTQAQSY